MLLKYTTLNEITIFQNSTKGEVITNKDFASSKIKVKFILRMSNVRRQ